MKKQTLLTLTLALLGAMSIGAKADVIADWAFDTVIPASAAAIAGANSPSYAPDSGAETATATIIGNHATVATYSAPAGNPSTGKAFSSNMWSVNDYWQAQVSTIGYTAITLSYQQYGSSTGPGTFQLEYSTDGSSFANIGSAYTLAVASTWYTQSPDLTSLDLSNNSSLYFRVVDASTISIGTTAGPGVVGTSGTDRLDNFIVSGTVVPEPATWAMMFGGLAFIGFLAKRRMSKV